MTVSLLYLVRIAKPFNYILGAIAMGTSYWGFLINLSYLEGFEIDNEGLVTIAFLSLGIIIMLAMMNNVFVNLEN